MEALGIDETNSLLAAAVSSDVLVIEVSAYRWTCRLASRRFGTPAGDATALSDCLEFIRRLVHRGESDAQVCYLTRRDGEAPELSTSQPAAHKPAKNIIDRVF